MVAWEARIEDDHGLEASAALEESRADCEAELERLGSAAEFLSSNEMRQSGRLHQFIESATDDDDDFERIRCGFLDAARLDTHRNSSWRRWLARHTKHARLDAGGLNSAVAPSRPSSREQS